MGSPASAPMDDSLGRTASSPSRGSGMRVWGGTDGGGLGGSAGAPCPPSLAWGGAGADSPRARTLDPLRTCPHGTWCLLPSALQQGCEDLAKETGQRGDSSPSQLLSLLCSADFWWVFFFLFFYFFFFFKSSHAVVPSGGPLLPPISSLVAVTR